MKIQSLFGKDQPVISFEFFPPKDDAGADALFQTIETLKQLTPSFVSVTYGAGGSTRRKTIDITERIKREIGIEAMAHLTCVGHSRGEILTLLEELEAAGIENIMALRGDPPKGETHFVPHPDGFRYASELVNFIRSQKSFCLGVAGYPEVHPEALSEEADLANLKRKVEAGGQFVVTQLFFDSKYYFDLVQRAEAAGIHVPIVPGIMPITNVAQIKRFTQMCGAKIPRDLMVELEAVEGNNEAVVQVGIQHTTNQCEVLLRGGAPGIHFYTLNKSLATRTIFLNLRARLGTFKKVGKRSS